MGGCNDKHATPAQTPQMGVDNTTGVIRTEKPKVHNEEYVPSLLTQKTTQVRKYIARRRWLL
jgi:hypothetical protein